MNICEPAIRRPVGTTLLAIGLLLVGIVAYRFLPVASMPTVDFPTISVSASRPGADPETMAATVAAPLERRLGEIPGVIELTSRSSLGSDPHHHPVRPQPQHRRRRARRAGRDQRRAVADLPGDLQSRPSFRKSNPAATPIMILALTSRTIPPSAHLRRRRHRGRAAPLADRRRRRGQRQRRRAAGDPRARQPDRARLHGAQHGGRAHRDRQHQCGRPARRVRRRRPRRHHRHQRSAARRLANTTRSWCAPPTAPWCGSPPSPRSSRACATAAPSAGTTGQPSVLLVITKQPIPT